MASEQIQKERVELAKKCADLLEQRKVHPTINGNPAHIGGFKSDFATITDMKTGLHAEWSWHAAYGILSKRGGAFSSI